MPGFKNYSQTGIVLEVGRNARVDATIELGAVSETVSVVGDSPLVDTASAVAGADGRPERGAEPAARQPRPVPAPEHHRRRHQQHELELARRAGAGDHDQRIRRGPDGHRQLPAGWREQHRGPARHRQPGAEPRSGAGIPRADQRLLGGVRPLLRGRRRHRDQVGDQRVSRRRLRLHPQREAELAALGAAGHGRHQRPARSQTVRRRVRRPDREGQDVLLRQLFGAAAGRDLLPQHRGGADGGRAGRRLLAVVDQAARSGDRGRVSRRDHSGGAVRYRGQDDSGPATCRCRTCRTTSTKCAPRIRSTPTKARSRSIISSRRRSPSRSATSISAASIRSR